VTAVKRFNCAVIAIDQKGGDVDAIELAKNAAILLQMCDEIEQLAPGANPPSWYRADDMHDAEDCISVKDIRAVLTGGRRPS
jgi:hypothetical protein